MPDNSDILVFKKLNAKDVIITPFKTHKEWLINNDNTGSYGIYVKQGIYNFSIGENRNINFVDENHLIFRHIQNSFYTNISFSPYKTTGPTNQFFETRQLNSKILLFTIPQQVYGERIKPKSVIVTNYSASQFTYQDDGDGNLYDTSIASASLVSDNNLIGRWSFDENFIYSGSAVELTLPINDTSLNNHTTTAYDVKFSNGIFSTDINLNGTSSYLQVTNNRKFNFRKSEDFSLSFWMNCPPTQSNQTASLNDVITKELRNSDGILVYGGYPFKVQLYNSGSDEGKLYMTRTDTNNLIEFTSSIVVNDSTYRHFVLNKTGSDIEFYIDGVLDGTYTDIVNGDVHNYSDLFFGTNGLYTNYFSGSLDEIRIYNKALTPTEVNQLYVLPENTDRVGNVFYSQGLICLTNPRDKYQILSEETGSNAWSLYFRGHHTIYEREIICDIGENEFNYTMNPTIRQTGELEDDRLAAFTTSSYFGPYITTVGFYDDKARLLAIGKLAKPIKHDGKSDLTLITRIDF